MGEISSSPSEIVFEINNSLAEHFRNRPNDYDTVSCLILTWSDPEDEGYKAEALNFKEFMENKLNYPSVYFEIPSKRSQYEVRRKIVELQEQLIGKRSLAIIYYGGHGDRDTEKDEDRSRPRRCVWSRKNKRTGDTETVNWSDIQTSLGEFEGDVLIILDCCYAGQCVRTTTSIIPPNVEIQAACAMDCTTPSPGIWSFTTKWLEVAGEMLNEKGSITISELHNSLGNRKNRLGATPQHWPIINRKGTIRLHPLPDSQQSAQVPCAASILLVLQIMATGAPDSNFLDEVQEWLKEYAENAPRCVSLMKATELVQNIFTASAEALDKEPQSKIRSRWRDAVKRLTSDASTNWGPEELSDEMRSYMFLRDFEGNFRAFQRVVDRGQVSLPALQERMSLFYASDNPAFLLQGKDRTLWIKFPGASLQHDECSQEDQPLFYIENEQSISPLPLGERHHTEFGQFSSGERNLNETDPSKTNPGGSAPSENKIDGGGMSRECDSKAKKLADTLNATRLSSSFVQKGFGWFRKLKHSRFFFHSKSRASGYSSQPL